MFVGQVIGTLIASEKPSALCGVKLMIVQPIDQQLQPDGEPLIAADTVGIGVGERAFCVIGKEAAMALSETFAPVDVAIVGIVDAVDIG
ncbi:MAG: EutN/CcmL family microcompartment protein [Candidatus Sericytochromatia bacterium]|nr:EutN/CcmL family microcompartment protein [Candidatus Sericytochromatia bacterium]